MLTGKSSKNNIGVYNLSRNDSIHESMKFGG